MRIYTVSFMKDNIFQVNACKTYHDISMVVYYYKQILGADKVLDVHETRPDDIKPSMPVIEF